MDTEGFRVTREFEEGHWWFRSRRDLIRMQVAKAAAALGYPQKPLRLLDFGCGTGFNLSLLSKFGTVTGADRFREYDAQFRLDHGFAMIDVERDLDAAAGQFDLVTALDVLEHLDDDVAGLVTLKRLLVTNGQILLMVPAYQWLWGGEDVISEHKRRYTSSQLQRACDAAGLRVEFISYFNMSILPMVTSVIWGRRLLAPSGPPKSSLSTPPRWLNEALYNLTASEASLVGSQKVRMPAGASIVCRLRKVDG